MGRLGTRCESVGKVKNYGKGETYAGARLRESGGNQRGIWISFKNVWTAQARDI